MPGTTQALTRKIDTGPEAHVLAGLGHALYRGLVFAARMLFEGLAYSGLAYAAPYAAWLAMEAENNVDATPRPPFRPGGPVTLPRLSDERQLVKEVEAYVRRAGCGSGPAG
jgi:hypothetical protein